MTLFSGNGIKSHIEQFGDLICEFIKFHEKFDKIEKIFTNIPVNFVNSS